MPKPFQPITEDAPEELSAPAAPAIDESAAPVVNSSLEDNRVSACIETWLAKHLRNSTLSRNPKAWAFLMSKLPHLAELIKGV